MINFSHTGRRRFYQNFTYAIDCCTDNYNNTLQEAFSHWQNIFERQRYYKNFAYAIDCCAANYSDTLLVSLKQWKQATWLLTSRQPLVTCTDRDICLVEKIFKRNAEITANKANKGKVIHSPSQVVGL